MDILKSIDIALGMVVVYLTFSLGVTALNESLAALLSSRARWLRKGIRALLESAPAADENVEAFYRSPYISALGRTAGWQPRFAPSYIAPWTLVQGLLDAANEAKGVPLATLEEIKKAMIKMPDGSPIKTALNDLIARADGNIDTLKKLVEAWFESFEAQISAWYRQKTQFVLVGLSALLAVAMNLDTVAMFRTLSADSKVRAELVKQALDASTKDSANAMLDLKPLQGAQKAFADAKAANRPAAELQPLQAKVDEEKLSLDKAAKDLLSDVQATGLPLGWGTVDAGSMNSFDWLSKVVGLALSAFALSMGAPFWFDLLQKLASIRSVGKSLVEREAKKAA